MPHQQTLVRRVIALFAATMLTAAALPAMAATETDDIQLIFPQDPLVTSFVDSYGFSRSGGRRHQGNDLMAPKMTPVYAAATGVVTSIDEGGTAGRWLVIDHGDGWETWYLHLNNDTPGTDDGRADWSDTVVAGLEEGMRVLAGQQIGYVGDSGNAEWTGPHTHFELHHDGRVVDPFPYIYPVYAEEVAGAMGAIVPRVGDLVTTLGSAANSLVGDVAASKMPEDIS